MIRKISALDFFEAKKVGWLVSDMYIYRKSNPVAKSKVPSASKPSHFPDKKKGEGMYTVQRMHF